MGEPVIGARFNPLALATVVGACGLFGCATEAPSQSDGIERIPLEDGVTLRLGGDSGLLDAESVVLTDGSVELAAHELVGDLSIGEEAYVDLTPRLRADGTWSIDIAPEANVARAARLRYCSEWLTSVYYVNGESWVSIDCVEWTYI